MVNESFPAFSKYEILGVLGQGSMGMVYKAHHRVLGRMVALKVPRRDVLGSQTSVERFLREGRALAMLQHPHIVSVYDADEEKGLPYIAMEYIEGGTLSHQVQQSRHIDFTNIQRWITQVALALDYIHQRGILHRDLKCSNVLISKEGRAHITDFGIAQVESNATITNGMIGTPAYMSPEQAKGKRLDHRSDIYSVGVILYEVLTSRIPFMEENGLALIQEIIHGRYQPVEVFRSDTPPWLAQITYRCLEKSPDRRYQSATELVQDLEEQGKGTASTLSQDGHVEHILNKIRWKTIGIRWTREWFQEIYHFVREARVVLLSRLEALIPIKPVYALVAFLVFSIVTMLWVFSMVSKNDETELPRQNQIEIEADSSTVRESKPPQKKNKPNWQPW